MAQDWAQIKNEYVTTQISYRDLAEKYGVNLSTISRNSKKEGWVEQRKQYAHKKSTKIQAKKLEKDADRATKMISVTDQLTDRLVDALNNMDMSNVPALRQVASALKDIREIYGLNKSELDVAEQKARIKNLEKAAEPEKEEKQEVVITFGGSSMEWAK